ncbi:MAG: ABC transporter permease [Actinobacteria bacterium]|nr:ABC transporter permease [Actinomycetota bacterium]
MARYALKRVLQSVPVVFVVSILSFLLLRAAPGNPAQAQAGLNATPKVVAAISRQLGLDKPLWTQYWIWLKGILHGSLGVSYTTGQPVTSVLAPRVPVTAELAGLSVLLTVVVGVPLGIWSSLRKDKARDQLTRFGALLFIAVPSFVIGLLFVLVFGWWVHGVLPYEGFVPISSGLGPNLSHLVLPALALSLGPIGITARFTRTSMLETLGSEYVLSAKALGVPRWQIILRDALRNALTPILTILGLIAGYLMSGTVVVETIFSLPGLGEELVSSFNSRDYTVTISVMMIFAVVFVVINLLVDVIYGFVDPRIRLGYVRRSS